MKVYTCRDCELSCVERVYPGFPPVSRMVPTDEHMKPNAGWTVCSDCFEVRRMIGSERAYDEEVQP